jgi:hypothetical protein
MKEIAPNRDILKDSGKTWPEVFRPDAPLFEETQAYENYALKKRGVSKPQSPLASDSEGRCQPFGTKNPEFVSHQTPG